MRSTSQTIRDSQILGSSAPHPIPPANIQTSLTISGNKIWLNRVLHAHLGSTQYDQQYYTLFSLRSSLKTVTSTIQKILYTSWFLYKRTFFSRKSIVMGPLPFPKDSQNDLLYRQLHPAHFSFMDWVRLIVANPYLTHFYTLFFFFKTKTYFSIFIRHFSVNFTWSALLSY